METAGYSDAQLVARCRAGEADAWDAFVERFSRYVYAICSQIGRASWRERVWYYV